MAEQKNNQRITAVVPSYNEAGRIGRVLDILTTYPKFKEVIVVDDGSTDHSAEVIKQYKVRYIRNKANKGKGYSMDVGVKLAQGDIIFFCDADVVGLNHHIIAEITQPVLQGKVDMFIAMRNRKLYYLHYLVVFIPLLGGERALTKALWQKLPDYYKYNFRVEAGLNFYAKYYGKGFSYKIFKKLSQVAKERKYGFWQGTKQRWGMMGNIIGAQLKLQFVDIPRTIQNVRKTIFLALQSSAGAVLGGLIFAANHIPKSFSYWLDFSQWFQGKFGASLLRFLLNLVKAVSLNIIAVVGIIIVAFNLAVLFFSLKQLIEFINNSSSKQATNNISTKIDIANRFKT